jgi:NitT/TauT family transport system substrate-binding protein
LNTPFTFYLDWKLGAQFAGLLWASEEGLYEASGLDVTLVPWKDEDSGTVFEKVLRWASDDVLCAGCAEDNLIVKQTETDHSVLAFGAMLQDTPLVLMSRSERPIRSFHDLREKRIGMHADGIRILEMVLAMEGIAVADVHIEEVGFDLDHLRQDRFDALQGYTMTEPVQLAGLGLDVAVLPVKHPRLKPYAQVYFSEGELLLAHRDVFTAFLAASNAGWLAVCANPDRAAELIAHGMSSAIGEPFAATDQRRMLERVIPLVLGELPFSQVGTIDTAQWHQNLATYAEYGLTNRELTLDDVVFDLRQDPI